jgi:hypothetical protein
LIGMVLRIFMVLAAAFLAACTQPHPLIGSWQRLVRPDTNPFVLTLTFNADGTYRAGHHEATTGGEYVVTGSTITIMDDDCHGQIGKYTFSVAGRQLTFTMISDPSNRPEVLPGIWYRK